MSATARKKRRSMKNHVSRTGRLLGAWVPLGVFDGVKAWIAMHPERDLSSFIREASREKLRKDGIRFQEPSKGLHSTECPA